MVRIEHLDKLNKALTIMGRVGSPRMGDAIGRAAEHVFQKAKLKAPGNLKNGMYVDSEKSSRGIIYRQIKFKKGFSYGVPVELGHRLVAWGRGTNKVIRPQPFLRPAADESYNEVVKIVADELNRIIEIFGGGT